MLFTARPLQSSVVVVCCWRTWRFAGRSGHAGGLATVPCHLPVTCKNIGRALMSPLGSKKTGIPLPLLHVRHQIRALVFHHLLIPIILGRPRRIPFRGPLPFPNHPIPRRRQRPTQPQQCYASTRSNHGAGATTRSERSLTTAQFDKLCATPDATGLAVNFHRLKSTYLCYACTDDDLALSSVDSLSLDAPLPIIISLSFFFLFLRRHLEPLDHSISAPTSDDSGSSIFAASPLVFTTLFWATHT